MRFRLLGPLEATDGAGVVHLGGVRRRAVMAYLLLHRGETVSTTDLVDALWPHNPPLTAVKVVQNAISHIRALLLRSGAAERPALLTRPGGYLLSTPPGSLDLDEFRRLVESAEADLAACRWDRTVVSLQRALGLRRGPILGDLDEQDLRWDEIDALRRTYVEVRTDWAVASLMAGRHRQVTDALLPLPPVGCWRLHGLLMIALYRGGRQADALATGRPRSLIPEIMTVMRAILLHDPRLDVPGMETMFLSSPASHAPLGRELLPALRTA